MCAATCPGQNINYRYLHVIHTASRKKAQKKIIQKDAVALLESYWSLSIACDHDRSIEKACSETKPKPETDRQTDGRTDVIRTSSPHAVVVVEFCSKIFFGEALRTKLFRTPTRTCFRDLAKNFTSFLPFIIGRYYSVLLDSDVDVKREMCHRSDRYLSLIHI